VEVVVGHTHLIRQMFRVVLAVQVVEEMVE
jgi:hypothetical protein